MSEFLKLRPAVRAFVTIVVLLGAATLAHSIRALYADPIGEQWFVLAALTLLTGSFSVKVPSINAYISVSETFVFASVLLFGTPAGTVTVLLECMVIVLWMKPQGQPVHRMFFNMAAPAVAIWVSGTVFYLLSGIPPYSVRATPLPELFLPLLTFTALYFLLNSWMVAIAVGLENGKRPASIWWKNFAWLSVNYFSGASVAALIVTYTRRLDFSTLAIIVPLLVVEYLTFRTAMGRAEDSYNHLRELNKLYLSTIETLAMAIDAKDQITHGHIRRVQAYAVGLASHVGITDEKLIRAIEAAALLHDMGKLAVPEYILNKPGKLTGAEFEKMKLHASVGADILSAIDFPYPVVPIVRHHHENWDGGGYPTGIKGTDIPIGARILSVVDCFDALTSDRPYRPRLSDADAIKILLDRRGTMYDPLVVDTFIRVHQQIAPEPTPSSLPGNALDEITSAAQNAVIEGAGPRQPLDDIAASADEMQTLYELSGRLASASGVAETTDVVVQHLRRLIPFSQSVMFLYEVGTDEIVARHAVGEASPLIKGLRIPLGQRLSGWVAANRKTIRNSDPTLDLGEVVRTLATRPRSCLSTPLVSGDTLIGVLTLYCDPIDGFTEDHQRIMETVASPVAHTLKGATELERPPAPDPVTGLPALDRLEQLLDIGQGASASLNLLFIDVLQLDRIGTQYGRNGANDVLRHVARLAGGALGKADTLFRHGGGLVAVLDGRDVVTTRALGTAIRRLVVETPVTIAGTDRLAIDVDVAAVSTSRDGASLRDLATTGRFGRVGPAVLGPVVH